MPQLTGLSANDEGEESSAYEEEDDELHAQGHRTGGGMFDTGDEEMEEELKNTLERLGIKIEDLDEDEVEDADAQLDAADRNEDENVEQRVRVKKFKVKATNTEEKQEPVMKQSKCRWSATKSILTDARCLRIGGQGLFCHQIY